MSKDEMTAAACHLAVELAAAEERGRRCGVEEARLIVGDEEEGPCEYYSQLGNVSDFRNRCLTRIDAALAPRDSAPVGTCVGHLGPPSNTGQPHPRGSTCSYWKEAPRDSGKDR